MQLVPELPKPLSQLLQAVAERHIVQLLTHLVHVDPILPKENSPDPHAMQFPLELAKKALHLLQEVNEAHSRQSDEPQVVHAAIPSEYCPAGQTKQFPESRANNGLHKVQVVYILVQLRQLEGSQAVQVVFEA